MRRRGYRGRETSIRPTVPASAGASSFDDIASAWHAIVIDEDGNAITTGRLTSVHFDSPDQVTLTRGPGMTKRRPMRAHAARVAPTAKAWLNHRGDTVKLRRPPTVSHDGRYLFICDETHRHSDDQLVRFTTQTTTRA
jgi:hypothetical protein